VMCILKAGPSVGPNPVTGKGIVSTVNSARSTALGNVAREITRLVDPRTSTGTRGMHNVECLG